MSATTPRVVTVINRCPHCALTTKTVLYNTDPHVVKLTCIHCGHQFWGADLSMAEPSTPRRRGLREWWRSLTNEQLNTISVGLLSVALVLHLILELFTQ